MVFGGILPKGFDFFELFDKQAAYAVEAAVHFAKMVSDFKVDEYEWQKMKEIEHKGDEVNREVLDRLNKTFITPFDREDIHSLGESIRNISESIHSAAKRYRLYRITQSTEFAR